MQNQAESQQIILEESKVYANSIGAFTIVFLAGIYLFPERIKIFAVFFILAFVFVSFSGTQKLLFDWHIVLWLAFLLIGFITCIAYNPSSIGHAIEFIVSAAIGLLVTLKHLDGSTRKKILVAILIVCALAFVGCVLQLIAPGFLLWWNRFALGEEQYKGFLDFFSYGALTGFSYQTGVTAFYLAILEGMLLSKLFSNNTKKRDKLWQLLLFLICYAFILLTRKRAQLLIVLLAAELMLCIHYRKHLFRILAISLILISGVVILLFVTPVGQSILRRTFDSQDASTGRFKIYSQMLTHIQQKPIFGNGFGSTLVFIRKFTNGHNIFLQVASETGVTGLLIILILFASYLVQAFKTFKLQMAAKQDLTEISICIFLQVNFLISGLIGNPLYDVYPLFIYLLSVSAVASIYREVVQQRGLSQNVPDAYFRSR